MTKLASVAALSPAVIACGVLAANPAHAITASFNFSTNPEVNFSSKVFTSTTPGFSTTVSSPITGSFVPASGGLNASALGLCAFAKVGTQGGRCGYNTADGATVGDGLTGFKFTFNQDVSLKTFDISQFAPPGTLSGTTLTFSSGLFNESFVITGGNTSYNFSAPFLATAGTDVFVTSTGTTTAANGGTFRIESLSVEEVPGPLSILGLGAAIGFSRKLKRKANSLIN